MVGFGSAMQELEHHAHNRQLRGVFEVLFELRSNQSKLWAKFLFFPQPKPEHSKAPACDS